MSIFCDCVLGLKNWAILEDVVVFVVLKTRVFMRSSGKVHCCESYLCWSHWIRLTNCPRRYLLITGTDVPFIWAERAGIQRAVEKPNDRATHVNRAKGDPFSSNCLMKWSIMHTLLPGRDINIHAPATVPQSHSETSLATILLLEN